MQMQSYTVTRRVDAFVDYVATVTAASPTDAARLAREQEQSLAWRETSTTIFEARTFITLDCAGKEIAGTEQGDF
jgi:hypothetical protein